MTQTRPNPTIELSTQTELSETDRHRLLTSERRRRILALLSNRTAAITCQELAELLVVAEHGHSDPSADALRQARVSLHHCHLPMLSDLGLIEYDPATSLVECQTL